MRTLADAANTLVPAILALKALGFSLECVNGQTFRAVRGDETYIADDPLRLLGLVKLVEERTWSWSATDSEIQDTLKQYALE